MLEIIGGDWLRVRDNYDEEMCRVNGWTCVQERHYDAVADGLKVEVKKTKTSATIIKLQQLAEITLDETLQDVNYLVVRTDTSQERVQCAFLVPSMDLAEIVGMTHILANQVLGVHQAFGCTIQMSIKQSDINRYRIQG